MGRKKTYQTPIVGKQSAKARATRNPLEAVEREVLKVIDNCGGEISLAKLANRYQQVHGKSLDHRSMGFERLKLLVESLPGRSVRIQAESSSLRRFLRHRVSRHRSGRILRHFLRRAHPKEPEQVVVFKVGDNVAVKSKDGTSKDRPGKITKANQDGTYDIKYGDKTTEERRVKVKRIKLWRVARAQTSQVLEGLRVDLGGSKQQPKKLSARQLKINRIKTIVEKSGAPTLVDLMKEIDKHVDFDRPSRTEDYYARHLDHHWVLTFAEAQDRPHTRTLIIYLFRSNHERNNQNVRQYEEILRHLEERPAGGTRGYRLVAS